MAYRWHGHYDQLQAATSMPEMNFARRTALQLLASNKSDLLYLERSQDGSGFEEVIISAKPVDCPALPSPRYDSTIIIVPIR